MIAPGSDQTGNAQADSLVCRSCGMEYPLNEPVWRCKCGGLLDVRFQARLDKDLLARRPAGLWKYREAIPLEDDRFITSLGEGGTPILELEFSGRGVWIKQEQLSPSGSFKDRGASVLVSKARELGIRKVVEDSSGNAGAAFAAYCARAGIDCHIFVPGAASPGKLRQIEGVGGRLVRIEGSREQTAEAALKAAMNLYYASHCWNPFFFQGTKTFAYEICEQLGWNAPDRVVLPAGNGTLLLGAWFGFLDLLKLGWISRLPKMIAVQAEACAPLVRMFQTGSDHAPAIEKKATRAEGIAVAAPVRGEQIVGAVKESGGRFHEVTEAQIDEAYSLCRGRGFFIEATAAAAVAGLLVELKQCDPDERIAGVFTGHGLKE